MSEIGHNYMKKLERLAAEGQVAAGDLVNMRVYHDDECAIFDGGFCDCDPDLEFAELVPETE